MSKQPFGSPNRVRPNFLTWSFVKGVLECAGVFSSYQFCPSRSLLPNQGGRRGRSSQCELQTTIPIASRRFKAESTHFANAFNFLPRGGAVSHLRKRQTNITQASTAGNKPVAERPHNHWATTHITRGKHGPPADAPQDGLRERTRNEKNDNCPL